MVTFSEQLFSSRFTKTLIDPSYIDLRGQPKDVQELAIAINNTYLPAFDNISYLSDAISDGLCRASTGGVLTVRELYTTTEESVIFITSPIIINGISDLANKPDVAERMLSFIQNRIPATQFLTDQEHSRDVEIALPKILGALVQVVSKTMKILPNISLDESPRMKGFALQGIAVEKILNWEPGTFLNRYSEMLSTLSNDTAESSPAITALISFMQNRTEWKGTITQLKYDLEGYSSELMDRYWPKTPRGLSNALRQYAGPLREHGIYREEMPRESNARPFRLVNTNYTAGPKPFITE